MKRPLVALLLLGLVSAPACAPEAPANAEPVAVSVPPGASFSQVVDTLTARGLVHRPRIFSLFARWKGLDTQVKSGNYALAPGQGWEALLEALTTGRVVTRAVTIPEGWALRQIVPRIAEYTGRSEAEVASVVADTTLHRQWGVPGPGLEGYLLPETYRFADGTEPEVIVRTMVEHYDDFWTPQRLARLDTLGYDQRELTTLASIVQAEARFEDEMPLIAAVYHNRLRQNWPLQADPTVLYALGGPRERLLYAAMDSVADSPYNTYTQPGLPPGPIGAPGVAALEATLHPADDPAMFFVVDQDGRHVFSRTLAEHNRAVAEYRRRMAGGGGGQP